MSQLIEFNSDNFNEKIKSGIVVVDVKAEWCRPCATLSPILEQVANDLGENVLIGKLDADKNGDLCSELDVRNLPTLLYYKDGELKQRTVGLKMKKDIIKIINSLSETN
jgi:thioredoxin 1